MKKEIRKLPEKIYIAPLVGKMMDLLEELN
jgi:hypothetical protein